jgi:TusA-related sulfurtransferase
MERLTDVVDVRGKSCPVDVIVTKLALDRCTPGIAVKILATDPEFPRSLEVICRQTGNRIIDSNSTRHGFAFVVVKKGGSSRFEA